MTSRTLGRVLAVLVLSGVASCGGGGGGGGGGGTTDAARAWVDVFADGFTPDSAFPGPLWNLVVDPAFNDPVVDENGRLDLIHLAGMACPGTTSGACTPPVPPLLAGVEIGPRFASWGLDVRFEIGIPASTCPLTTPADGRPPFAVYVVNSSTKVVMASAVFGVPGLPSTFAVGTKEGPLFLTDGFHMHEYRLHVEPNGDASWSIDGTTWLTAPGGMPQATSCFVQFNSIAHVGCPWQSIYPSVPPSDMRLAFVRVQQWQ